MQGTTIVPSPTLPHLGMSGGHDLLTCMQVPEERNKDGQWVPKGSKPALQLSHQQVRCGQPSPMHELGW